MELPHIDLKIKKLVKTYGTRDPFRLAEKIGVIVLEEDLGHIYGYYNREVRIKTIHINSRMSEEDRLLTCAHELGHSILHSSENTPMLSKASIVSELKIEKEANYFATRLLIDQEDDELSNLCKYKLLDMYGLPEEFERFL